MSASGSDLVQQRPVPPEVEAAIKAALDGPNREESVLTLAAIANRAIAALNTLARTESNARRGQEDWGAWAALANAARNTVLQTATLRRTATALARGARGAEQT
jgi:hypothetical protein